MAANLLHRRFRIQRLAPVQEIRNIVDDGLVQFSVLRVKHAAVISLVDSHLGTSFPSAVFMSGWAGQFNIFHLYFLYRVNISRGPKRPTLSRRFRVERPAREFGSRPAPLSFPHVRKADGVLRGHSPPAWNGSCAYFLRRSRFPRTNAYTLHIPRWFGITRPFLLAGILP